MGQKKKGGGAGPVSVSGVTKNPPLNMFCRETLTIFSTGYPESVSYLKRREVVIDGLGFGSRAAPVV